MFAFEAVAVLLLIAAAEKARCGNCLVLEVRLVLPGFWFRGDEKKEVFCLNVCVFMFDSQLKNVIFC